MENERLYDLTCGIDFHVLGPVLGEFFKVRHSATEEEDEV